MSITISLVIDLQDSPVYIRKISSLIQHAPIISILTTYCIDIPNPYPTSNVIHPAAIMAFNLSKFSMREKEDQTISTGFMGTTHYALWELLDEHYNPARHDITGIFKALRYDDYANEMTECVVMICEQ